MKNCRNCINAKIIDVSRKCTAYQCDKVNYTFLNYWSKTKANDCKYYKE